MMLRIERQQKQFTRLDQPTFAAASITERYHLQEFIFNSAEAFFAEVGQDLFVIGKEIQPSEVIQDRIDLLALDREGKAVIIELKRGNDKLQLLQSIAYAGMIAKWKPSDFLSAIDAERREKLADFLNVDTDEINREQRLLLIAEAYDYEVLVGAEWLHDNYNLDILCCRVVLSTDSSTGAEYLSCTPVFPAPELARQAVPRRRIGIAPDNTWPDWGNALASISNPDVAGYFKSQIQAGQESYLPDRMLIYRVGGKRRWFLSARGNRAYCWQTGRFDDDIKYWSERLSNAQSVRAVEKGVSLRFLVTTAADFEAFNKSATKELLNTNWSENATPMVPEEEGEAIPPIVNS